MVNWNDSETMNRSLSRGGPEIDTIVARSSALGTKSSTGTTARVRPVSLNDPLIKRAIRCMDERLVCCFRPEFVSKLARSRRLQRDFGQSRGVGEDSDEADSTWS
jgi:hypothetical protein